MRKFYIKWYKKEKFGKPVERFTNITLPKADPNEKWDTLHFKLFDAWAAAGAKGGLKNNEIIEIQELTEKGLKKGEPIRPTDGTQVVPTQMRKAD